MTSSDQNHVEIELQFDTGQGYRVEMQRDRSLDLVRTFIAHLDRDGRSKDAQARVLIDRIEAELRHEDKDKIRQLAVMAFTILSFRYDAQTVSTIKYVLMVRVRDSLAIIASDNKDEYDDAKLELALSVHSADHASGITIH